ncbi:MAG TPA: Ig-like domain-containing protein [Gemmatimonadaceae bacterium]|nr:Ig-like domain-containing protein [Gemmatimonadaceae bacterium]
MKKLASPFLRLAVFALAVAAVIACGDNKLGPSVPASVSRVSGDSQTVLVGNRASAPLVALVKNTDGSPLPNVQVRWSVVSGGGSLTTIVDTTDVNGKVSNTYLSAAIVATAKVAAVAGGQSGEFTVILAPDTTGTITAFGGDGAAALVGNALTLTAKAVDRFGNAIKGIDVTWTTSSGQLQVQTGTTDSTGKTTNVITVGPDTGKVAIVATSRFNSITFTVSALDTI